MVLVDVNLLVHATNADSPDYAGARVWLSQLLQSKETVGLPWAVLVGFVRITTNPRILPNPLALDQALTQVNDWLALPNVQIIHPTHEHARVFSDLCRAANATGNLVTDAHLAALATEHGGELASCDDDFRKFAGLRWFNPLDTPTS
ncbi:MAG: type II toxin-antitoxin system VapC family toxin [Chthoniobacteraceae bacterium]